MLGVDSWVDLRTFAAMPRSTNQTSPGQGVIQIARAVQFLFSGSILAIRNPGGHEFGVRDSPDQCLDHLGLASLLLRRLEDAGFKCSAP